MREQFINIYKVFSTVTSALRVSIVSSLTSCAPLSSAQMCELSGHISRVFPCELEKNSTQHTRIITVIENIALFCCNIEKLNNSESESIFLFDYSEQNELTFACGV